MKSATRSVSRPMGGRHAKLEEVSDVQAIAPEQIRSLTRSEFDKLVELGAFANENLELLHGVIVRMPPIGAPHSWAVQVLNELLTPKLVGRATVRIGLPFAADDASEPQPDVAIAASGDYRREHPRTLLCAIEVADASLLTDRGIKARLYAESGVPEYWIVNLREGVMEVRTRPIDGEYTEVAIHHPGDVVRLEAFTDVEVPVADVLG